MTSDKLRKVDVPTGIRLEFQYDGSFWWYVQLRDGFSFVWSHYYHSKKRAERVAKKKWLNTRYRKADERHTQSHDPIQTRT